MSLLWQFFRGFQKGTRLFGENIAGIVNSILLLVVYVAGVGLTSIFAKIFGKHFLDIETSKERKTYWTDLNLNKKSMEAYYRQF